MSATRRDLQLALRRPLLDYCDGQPFSVLRAWDGKRFAREAGQPYVADSLIPSGQTLDGHARMRGLTTLEGIYVIQWYGLSNAGLALDDTADDVVALYPPGTAFVMADGNAVQVKANPAPWAGQIRPVTGAQVVTITVPYQCVTQPDVPADLAA